MGCLGCCGGNSVQPEGKRQHDPNFKGPIDDRSCTDVLFLLIFIAFWVGMVVIASLAFRDGEPGRIIYGYDSYGNVCSQDNSRVVNNSNSGLDMGSRDYLFYFDPTDDGALRICVSSCPGSNGDSTNATAFGLCLGQSPYSTDQVEIDRGKGIEANGCPSVYLASRSILNRCVPIEDTLGYASSVVSAINAGGVWTDVVSDLTETWNEILYMCIVAMVIALVLVFLMRLIAPIMIWAIYLAFLFGSLGLIGFLWYQYRRFKNDLDDTPEDERLESDEDNVKFYFYGAIAWSIVGGILVLILLIMFKRIKLVVALFKEASRVLAKMPLLLLMPIWTYIFELAVVIWFLFVYIFLYTSSDAKENSLGHVEYESNKELVYMQWYHIFGFLWTIQFVLAYQECAIAGAVAAWYFSRDKNLHLPIWASVYRVFRYHLGSIAFGSFIIAVVQLIRLILAYIQRKLKGKTGRIVDYALKCLQCCLWCFEKFLKFLNRNAYIEIAIYGYSFCKAARTAFMILLRNILRVAAINSVGDFVLFVGKLLVVVISGFVALAWFRSMDNVHYVAIPVFLVCVFAYFIANVFFSVFEMVIDTLFLCFCEDSERNDGSMDKPYFMSDNLMRFMDRSNRKKQKKTLQAMNAKPAKEEPEEL
eukprot:m.80628 g.80628  ORF g.80628 m.80628 type:complete len:645 (+) comp20931_c1_seq1:81-2015(+)